MIIGILREENFMEFVRFDWPESQEWMGEEFEDEVVYGPEAGEVLVPKELYERVNNKRR